MLHSFVCTLLAKQQDHKYTVYRPTLSKRLLGHSMHEELEAGLKLESRGETEKIQASMRAQWAPFAKKKKRAVALQASLGIHSTHTFAGGDN